MQKIFDFDIDILIVDWTSQDVADIVQIFETHDKYLRRSKIKMFH